MLNTLRFANTRHGIFHTEDVGDSGGGTTTSTTTTTTASTTTVAQQQTTTPSVEEKATAKVQAIEEAQAQLAAEKEKQQVSRLLITVINCTKCPWNVYKMSPMYTIRLPCMLQDVSRRHKRKNYFKIQLWLPKGKKIYKNSVC